MELTLFGDTVFRADSLTYFLFLYTLFVTGKRKPFLCIRKAAIKNVEENHAYPGNSDFLTNTLEVPVSGDM